MLGSRRPIDRPAALSRNLLQIGVGIDTDGVLRHFQHGLIVYRVAQGHIYWLANAMANCRAPYSTSQLLVEETAQRSHPCAARRRVNSCISGKTRRLTTSEKNSLAARRRNRQQTP